jgi:hypothetical protein
VIDKNITIEGAQPGSTTPGVTINGGGSASNFSDFTIDAGVTATFDGLIIADGHATGTAGSAGSQSHPNGGSGGGAAGGIYDAGTLKLTNSLLQNDTATGGTGGQGYTAFFSFSVGGGGAGGNAAGGVYVTATGTLDLYASDSFGSDSAHGGQGGTGGGYAPFYSAGGAGGAGGISGINGGVGSSGHNGPGAGPGQGGGPGQTGSSGVFGGGGGGGGGSAFSDARGAGTINGPVPCYCPGTLIETARGEVRVETLAIGGEVMTASGVVRPIKWIGRRSYGGRFVMGRKDILPVCIKAGALDENLPKRDLWISPHHAMYLDGVLIEAKDLINGASIVQAEHAESVEYFHIELETHDVIIAEGALAESFIDDDSRGMFHNAHDYDTLYADAAPAAAHYCAPRLNEGYEVEAVRQRLALRAGLSHADEATGTLRGYVDEVSAKRIAGWAQSAEHPDVPVCLDIIADGRTIAHVLANEFRRDLRRAVIGSGHHAFTFIPPQDIALAHVEVRRSLDNAVLRRGPNAGAFIKVHRRAKRA